MADLTAGDPRGVVFGRSATQLTFDFARTLARDWGPGDEVVVTRLDHDANIRPWVARLAGGGPRAASCAGSTSTRRPVSWTGRRLRAAHRPHPAGGAHRRQQPIGTRPDVRAVADAAHAVGALVWVDGVHYAAHALVDVAALGCDVFVCSPYKFFGPHHGALVAAPAFLEGLRPDKLLPSSDAVPERFELGTLPYELLAGTTAAVDHLAGLLPGAGSRRERLAASLAAAEEHEARLRRASRRPGSRSGATVYSRAAHRTSTLLFDLPGVDAADVAAGLAAAGSTPGRPLLRPRGVPPPGAGGPGRGPGRAGALQRRRRRRPAAGRARGRLRSCAGRRRPPSPPARRPAPGRPGRADRAPLRRRCSRRSTRRATRVRRS